MLAIGSQLQPQKIVAGLKHMSDLSLGQLKDVLDAYTAGRCGRARRVDADGEIGDLYTSLFRELLTT